MTPFFITAYGYFKDEDAKKEVWRIHDVIADALGSSQVRVSVETLPPILTVPLGLSGDVEKMIDEFFAKKSEEPSK